VAADRAATSVAWLDALDDEACAAALAPLFEGAPRFLARLCAARPFTDAPTLLDRAREVARTMPEDEQVELVDAHPRLGAPPGSVSAASLVEQGYDQPGAGEAAESERRRVDAELARLNAAYEARFGFRYCVFVASRPRAALLPELVAALDADRASELARALEAVVDIAEDRFRHSSASSP
jgi:2-oxo-4-hydroxy-4-carboxy--5-ureidoimidazoline (OHCU) decarboxylase